MQGTRPRYFQFDRLDPVIEQWQAIAEYNADIKDRLPHGARTFVCSDWHYNYHDPRCPHDSWIRSIDFQFLSEGSSLPGVALRLLGAFHDRNILIEYKNVSELSFDGRLISTRGRNIEWIYDEVHLLDTGLVEHIIEFSECLVRIECLDFEYRSEIFANTKGP